MPELLAEQDSRSCKERPSRSSRQTVTTSLASCHPHPAMVSRGRLIAGTAGNADAGGELTQTGGMSACLWGSAVMLGMCLALTLPLPSGIEARRVPA
jgi:hypothetical protein